MNNYFESEITINQYNNQTDPNSKFFSYPKVKKPDEVNPEDFKKGNVLWFLNMAI